MKYMQKTKEIVQHVQNDVDDVTPAELSRTRPSLKRHLAEVIHRINAVVASRKPSRQNKQQTIPAPMNMASLLAGRFIRDVSRPSLAATEPEINTPPGDDNVEQPVDDTAFPGQRARLFARLGIKSEATHASPDDIEKLIASLSHREVKERISAAHAIADIYKQLPLEKQVHARINLILMTWRDASAYGRIAAIKALGRTEMPDVSEALQVALRDDEQAVRAAAARALGEIRGKTSVVALIAAAMRKNEHWSVRAAVLRAMGASGERAFLNTINLALEDEDDSVRIAAIHALAQLEGLQAAPRLALIAQRDSQPHVKHAAILELEDLDTGE